MTCGGLSNAEITILVCVDYSVILVRGVRILKRRARYCLLLHAGRKSKRNLLTYIIIKIPDPALVQKHHGKVKIATSRFAKPV